MQIDENHDSFKNIAPLISRLNKQTMVEEDPISDNEEDVDDEEEENDHLMDDILSSNEDASESEEEVKIKEKPKKIIDDRRKNVRRAPRGRMNSRRDER